MTLARGLLSLFAFVILGAALVGMLVGTIVGEPTLAERGLLLFTHWACFMTGAAIFQGERSDG